MSTSVFLARAKAAFSFFLSELPFSKFRIGSLVGHGKSKYPLLITAIIFKIEVQR
jgi:hypothetical protein